LYFTSNYEVKKMHIWDDELLLATFQDIVYSAFGLKWVLADPKLLGSTSGTKHTDFVYSVLSSTGLGAIMILKLLNDYNI